MREKTLVSLWLWILLLPLITPACGQDANLKLNERSSLQSVARFDWFEYEGNDPIYRSEKAGPGQYLNPILPGFYPDPSFCRVGDDYYLVNSSFSYFPGVPIFHSKDLVNWTQIGHVLDRPSQLNLDKLAISEGIFAPTIRYHDGTFYMVTTLVGAGGNFFVTAKDPAGPWSDPVWLPEVDGIDPSFFFDDDGKAYLVNNGPPVGAPLYDGHRAIWIQEFDPKANKLTGPRSVIVNGGVDISKKPIWIEGPHIFKVKGQYYLMAAEGGTAEGHSEVIFRSASPLGPYKPYEKNPILTQRHLPADRPNPVTSTGHADLVETQNGEWWAVFLGCRPYSDDYYNIGRETFLMPVRWSDGWPVMTSGAETVPYVVKRPKLPARAPVQRSGNFRVRDDFDKATLELDWNFVRTPREKWHDLASQPGSLTIQARPAALGSRGQLSFVGRRQQHSWASASTSVSYTPAKAGDKAGLIAFQNDDFYYLLAVTLSDEGRPVVQLEKRAGKLTGGKAIVVAEAPLEAAAGSPVLLKIETKGPRCSFYYGVNPGRWTAVKQDEDATILSTKVAGGFVGAYLGMYAYKAD